MRVLPSTEVTQCVIIHRMLHVGLTGNIATGKSQAAHVFAELGAHVIDADVIAHDLLAKGTGTYLKVVEAFGSEILTVDGSISRRKLGEIVFNDSEKRKRLNRLVHPDVRDEVLRRVCALEESYSGGIIIVDAALLIESGHHKLYDRLIVVTCDPNLQVTRIINRDGLTVEQAKARMAAQMPAEEKLKLANYTIETSGTLRETRDQIEAIYRDLVLQELRLRNRE
jgi:dephospho-CoA kinase